MGKLKRFGLFLLLIIIVVALAPLITGILFKRSYTSFLEANSQGKVQIQQYNLGWLSSDAILYYPISAGAQDPASKIPVPTGVTVNQHIVHGPYLLNPWTGVHDIAQVAIQSVMHLDAKTEAFLLGPSTEGVMQINTLVSFLNEFTSEIQSPVYNIKLPSAGKISWQGISGTGDSLISGGRIKHVVSTLRLGALDAENNGYTFSMQPITLSVDMDCSSGSSLCTGTQETSLPQMLGVNPDGQSVKISGISFKTSSTLSGNDYGSTIEFGLNNLNTPDYTATSSSLKLAYDNLNATEMSKLLDKLKADQTEYSDMHSRQLAMAADINSGVAKLVTAKTVLTHNLRLNTSAGNIASSGRMYWPPKTPLPTTALEVALESNAELTVRASVSLVTQILKSIDEKNAQEEALAMANAPRPAQASPAAAAAADYESSLPEFVAFQTQVNTMATQKLIKPEQQTALIDAAKSRMAPVEFSNLVYGWYKAKQITAPPAKQLEAIYPVFFTADQKKIVDIVFSTPAANLHELRDRINTLVQINGITPTVGNELVDLQQQSLAPEIYAVALHKFVVFNVLSPELETQLKAQYSVINHDLSLNADAGISVGATPGVAPLTAPGSVAAAAPVQKGKTELQFEDLIRQGYVTLDGDSYVINVVYKDGALQINGHPYNGLSANSSGAVKSQ
jgi:uncharacterized protein YdgA (DUF945 family)